MLGYVQECRNPAHVFRGFAMRIAIRALLCLTCIGASNAQTPTGTVAGVVSDPSGGGVPGAQVRITSRFTGLNRKTSTSGQGDYGFAALPPGEYEVSVEAMGFEHVARQAFVEAGLTTGGGFQADHRRCQAIRQRGCRHTPDAVRFPHPGRRDHTGANRGHSPEWPQFSRAGQTRTGRAASLAEQQQSRVCADPGSAWRKYRIGRPRNAGHGRWRQHHGGGIFRLADGILSGSGAGVSDLGREFRSFDRHYRCRSGQRGHALRRQ